MALKLGLTLGTGGNKASIDMDYVHEAENLGFDSVWTAEAWGSDALSPAAWILAQTNKIKVGTGIVQMPARTPSSVAMTAMTLDHLSDGRFILGLGPSGPQVIEGWYGVPYGRPLTRLREYVEIIRKIMERKEPLRHQGFHYQIPMTGDGTTGLGKPLKSVLHGDPNLTIVSAAISPSGVKAAAEIVDGFIPIYMDPDRFDIFEPDINAGLEKAGGGKSLSDFMVLAYCQVRMNDDLEEARQPVRENLAFTSAEWVRATRTSIMISLSGSDMSTPLWKSRTTSLLDAARRRLMRYLTNSSTGPRWLARRNGSSNVCRTGIRRRAMDMCILW